VGRSLLDMAGTGGGRRRIGERLRRLHINIDAVLLGDQSNQ
jgi:hypothetical protein